MNQVKNGHFFFLWAGAAISISEILTGTLLGPLGLIEGILVILIGHLLGTAILVLAGYIGTKENETAIGTTGRAFGPLGKKLFALLNVLQLLGWTAVMLKAGGQQVNAITKSFWSFDSPGLSVATIGLLTLIWVVLKVKRMNRVNLVAVSFLLVVTVILFFQLVPHSSINVTKGSGLSFGGGLELTIVMPISWLSVIADYNRVGRTPKGTAISSFFGYTFGSVWMYVIGLLLSLAHLGLDNLLGNIAIMGALVIVLSTVTTTFLDVKSAGISTQILIPKLKERPVMVGISLLGCLLAILVPMSQYENFLYLIGSLFAPMYAVVLTKYFLLNKKQVPYHYAFAFISWLLGIGIYQIFIRFDFFIGATLPTMVFTSLLYFLGERAVHTWILKKNFSQPVVK